VRNLRAERREAMLFGRMQSKRRQLEKPGFTVRLRFDCSRYSPWGCYSTNGFAKREGCIFLKNRTLNNMHTAPKINKDVYPTH
jgi:hypothetical protein